MIHATSTDSVPFPQSPPTEPSEALLQARYLFSSLETWLSSTPTLELPLHLVERQQECKGRQLQRMLLQAHVQHRGTGDVGPVCASSKRPLPVSTHATASSGEL